MDTRAQLSAIPDKLVQSERDGVLKDCSKFPDHGINLKVANNKLIKNIQHQILISIEINEHFFCINCNCVIKRLL